MAKGLELLGRFKPGDNVPVYATGVDIAAGHLVTINGRNAKNAYTATHTGAGLYASGVAEVDAIAGLTDWRGGTNITRRGSIARVIAGAAIPLLAGGQTPVKSDATGRVIPQGGTGIIVGYCLGQSGAAGAATAAGQIVDVDLI
ncbi:MAG: hypothetical protein LC798_15640 [Chloroflexi bacterium]|nr:hypothetical protein [Chloroflexota bacterium]